MLARRMSSTDDHAHEPHPHPPLPTVHDEAGDTPTWVPIAGLAFFVVIFFFALVRSALAPEAPAASAVDELAAEPAAIVD